MVPVRVVSVPVVPVPSGETLPAPPETDDPLRLVSLPSGRVATPSQTDSQSSLRVLEYLPVPPSDQ